MGTGVLLKAETIPRIRKSTKALGQGLDAGMGQEEEVRIGKTGEREKMQVGGERIQGQEEKNQGLERRNQGLGGTI